MPRVYNMIESTTSKCAAQVKDGPCTGYLGSLGTGNYIKMIHNRIKYGDIQLIGKVYGIMKHILKLGNDKMAVISEEWDRQNK